MTIDYGNQITNLIAKYLPYTDLSFGSGYQAESIDVVSGKVTLTFDSSDYSILSDIINDPLNPNSVFTTSGFYLKNTITSFIAYPSDSVSPYAFNVGFRLPHKLKKDQIITLKGFTDTDYDIQYKVFKAEDQFSAYLYPLTTVTVETLTSGLGFLPVNYTEGFNGIKTITDEGSNQLSFTFEPTAYFTEITVDNIDTDYLPYINYYLDNLKYMSFATFLRNMVDSTNQDYLIIDSSSFITFPLRSNSNNSDSDYNSYSRSGYFDLGCSITVYYLIERNIDDQNNQTGSGSDILMKHNDMLNVLISILRLPLDSDTKKVMSSITVARSEPNNNIIEGRTIIEFELQFKISYQDSILIDMDIEDSYPIDSLNYNENIIDLT